MNHTLNQRDLTNIQKIPSNSSRIHILLKHTWYILQHRAVLGHKTRLSKFKKTDIIVIIFSDHKGIKLEINNRSKAGKLTNMWILNNMLLHNQWVKEEIKQEIKKYLKTNKNITYENLWDATKAVLRRKLTTTNGTLRKNKDLK